MIDKAYIIGLIEQGETNKVEFKLNFSSKVIVALNALANSLGGYVIIGISDNGDIIGVDLNKESTQNWINEVKQKTSPSIIPELIEFRVNEKVIVVFSVVEYPIKPIAYQGRYYARKNNSNHLLTVDEIVEFRFSSLNLSFDSYLVRTKFDELDIKSIQKFIDLTKDTGKFSFTGNALFDLNKLGLLNDGNVTRAAELLFGNHQTCIHLGRFRNKTTIIDDVIIKEPLVLALDLAMTFIKKNIQVEYEFIPITNQSRWLSGAS